jgi:deoxyribonuclease V
MKWPPSLTLAEAKGIQEQLRQRIRLRPFRGEPRYIAGVDAAFSHTKVCAAACLYRYGDRSPLEQVLVVRQLSFPYIPGYLSFREGPAIVDALKRLKEKPDVVLADGQGIAHPRGVGLASFLGLLLGIPSIGCAKSRLVGEYREPLTRKGNWTELLYNGTVVGAVLRTRDSVKPLFLSPGHLIDLQSSIRIALGCVGNYRIPEPLRCADLLSKRARRYRERESPLQD